MGELFCVIIGRRTKDEGRRTKKVFCPLSFVLRQKSIIMGLFSFLTRKKEQKEDLDKGLEKTKTSVFSRISKAIMGKSTVDDEVLDNLEEILITSDVGVETTLKIIDRIQARVARDKYVGTNELNTILKEEIMGLLQENESGDGTTFDIPAGKKPYVIMVVGVNGVGKTTTIGKLAYNFKNAGKKVVLGASDTFRAAAVSQLQIWAERVGVPCVQQGQGADPASVAFDTVKSAVAQDADVVIIDTAGRLHNKVNLMRELTKIKTVMQKVVPDAPHEILLVLDASTGQNSQRPRADQARRHRQGRRGHRHLRPVQDPGQVHRRRRRHRPPAGLRQEGVRGFVVRVK